MGDRLSAHVKTLKVFVRFKTAFSPLIEMVYRLWIGMFPRQEVA